MVYKKCIFPKAGTRFHQLRKKKDKSTALTPAQRAKKIKEWNGGW